MRRACVVLALVWQQNTNLPTTRWYQTCSGVPLQLKSVTASVPDTGSGYVSGPVDSKLYLDQMGETGLLSAPKLTVFNREASRSAVQIRQL